MRSIAPLAVAAAFCACGGSAAPQSPQPPNTGEPADPYYAVTFWTGVDARSVEQKR